MTVSKPLPIHTGSGPGHSAAAPRYHSSADLKNVHVGKRGVVLGSGPSLRRFRSSLLNKDDLVVVGINEEGHRHKQSVAVDYWMFSDVEFLKRINDNDYEGHPDTTLLLNRNLCKYLHEETLKLPSTGNPPRTWTSSTLSRYESRHGPEEYFLHKTTATAAICHLVMTGIDDIWLGGVDVCFSEDYYKDKDKRRNPTGEPTHITELPDGIKMLEQNIHMMADLSGLHETLPDVTLSQGCEWSPFIGTQVQSFREWYGR